MKINLIAGIAKGIIRDQNTRRHTMFFVILAALLLLFCGVTFLNSSLVERPMIFILFWGACAWLTILSILLAIYDLLVVRARARALRRELLAKVLKKEL
jgi:hypothetical protein